MSRDMSIWQEYLLKQAMTVLAMIAMDLDTVKALEELLTQSKTIVKMDINSRLKLRNTISNSILLYRFHLLHLATAWDQE